MAVEYENPELLLTPTRVLNPPFTTLAPAFAPIHVFPSAVVKAFIAPKPTLVLLVPVVKFAKAEYPNAELLLPLVILFKQTCPNPEFPVPVYNEEFIQFAPY